MSFGAGAGGIAQRTITAMFDSRTDAEEAVARLESAGVAKSGIRLMPGYERDTDRDDASVGRATEGFWDSLRDLFLPDEDRSMYAEGLSRGGYLVTVNVSDAQYERALDILDDEGTIDIDERAESWRSEGWTGASTASSASTARTGLSDRTTSSTGMADRGRAEDEEVIPVAEEELHVGKRDTGHGRVRVRSYVVERPVQEQVTLREEHVEVERRPVTGAARTGAAGQDLFRERSIEMDERREEAVVSKETRVKEELVVKKDVDTRTETISDTVRSTEVEIDDERGRAGTGTTGASGFGTPKRDR